MSDAADQADRPEPAALVEPVPHTRGKVFAVRPTGWVRPSFVYLADDDDVVTDQDGFVLSARLGAEAKLERWLVAKIEVELSPEPSLKDAMVSVAPTVWARLDVGQFKLPASTHLLASDTRRILPESPRAVGELTSRDLGAAATLSLPIAGRNVASVTSGVYNGEGANRVQNVNQDFLFVQRLLVTPFGARATAMEGTDGATYLGVGGGWLYNRIGEDVTLEEVNQYVAEVQAAWRWLSVQGEVVTADHAYANPDLANYEVFGWYGQVGSFVPVGWAAEHLELAARLGLDDPDLGSEGSYVGPTQPATREITGGLNLYARVGAVPLHDVKLSLAWTHLQELEGAEAHNDRLAVAGTARF